MSFPNDLEGFLEAVSDLVGTCTVPQGTIVLIDLGKGGLKYFQVLFDFGVVGARHGESQNEGEGELFP